MADVEHVAMPLGVDGVTLRCTGRSVRHLKARFGDFPTALVAVIAREPGAHETWAYALLLHAPDVRGDVLVREHQRTVSDTVEKVAGYAMHRVIPDDVEAKQAVFSAMRVHRPEVMAEVEAIWRGRA